MRKNDLQRDKAFRQRLAQKLEVEQPPESYFQAVQSAFASLPDELPVKARPIHQRVLRTCAALAACCAVVVAGAFGLNQVSPQLMESMPGIGQIFQDFNEGREPPVPTPSPTPPSETESQLEQQEVQQEVPPFEPLSVPSNTGVGELTIQNAWSDGLYLHLELELAAEGRTVLLSTHIFSLVEKVCDRVGIVIDGRMVASGTLPEVAGDRSLEDAFFDLYAETVGEAS